MNFVRRFLAFWYDFIIGDDWVVAAGVVILLAVTGVLAHVNLHTTEEKIRNILRDLPVTTCRDFLFESEFELPCKPVESSTAVSSESIRDTTISARAATLLARRPRVA